MKKTAEERLKEKGITILTKHHSYEYLYKSFVDILNDFATQPSDELPSDETVREEAERKYTSFIQEESFRKGAKYIRSIASRLLASKDARIKELEEALKEIAEGKGRYSQDKLEHASNTIQDMIQLANNVLTPPKN